MWGSQSEGKKSKEHSRGGGVVYSDCNTDQEEQHPNTIPHERHRSNNSIMSMHTIMCLSHYTVHR